MDTIISGLLAEIKRISLDGLSYRDILGDQPGARLIFSCLQFIIDLILDRQSGF